MRLIFLCFLSFLSVCHGRDYISIAGSSAMYPFFILAAQAFAEDNLGRAPVVESTGTGAGLKAFCSGQSDNDPDVAMASRPISLGEAKLCIKNNIHPPLELEFGYDAVVLLRDAKSPLVILTVDMIRQALMQQKPLPKNWHQIDENFPEIPISFVGPATTSGSYETFADALFGKRALGLRVDGAYQEVAGQETVVIQKLQINPLRLGVLSYSFLKKSKHPMRIVAVNGIYPNPITIRSGLYPLSRKFYLYVKRERLGDPQVRKFLQYLYSFKMMGSGGILEAFGLVTLSQNRLAEQILKEAMQ